MLDVHFCIKNSADVPRVLIEATNGLVRSRHVRQSVCLSHTATDYSAAAVAAAVGADVKSRMTSC